MKLESHEARAAAARAQALRQALDNSASQPVNSLIHRVSGALEGRTAEALEEQLQGFLKDARILSEQLGYLQKQLIAYAEKIEWLDRISSQLIHSN